MGIADGSVFLDGEKIYDRQGHESWLDEHGRVTSAARGRMRLPSRRLNDQGVTSRWPLTGPDLRRVVITGMGIVSSIGDTIKEVTDSLKNGVSGISFMPGICRQGLQVAGRRQAQRHAGRPCRQARHALHGRWRRLVPHVDDAGDRGRGPRREHHLQSAHRPHRRHRRSLDARHRGGGRLDPRERLAAPHRAVRRAEGDVVDRVGDALHPLQDSRRELFDLVGLHDVAALRGRRDRADPVGQAGRDVRRRRRGTRLDAVLPVRRAWRDVVEVQCRAAPRLARLSTPIAMAS